MELDSTLKLHALPELYVRAPTAGPLTDMQHMSRFMASVIKPTGVRTPAVLVIDLEGRFPTAEVIFDLVVRVGGAFASGQHGEVSLVIATPDQALAGVIRAVAEANGVSLFLAESAEAVDRAEPVGPLSTTDRETLAVLKRLGGRASVANVARAAAVDHTAAGNRLSGLDKRNLLLRIERPRREGNIYLDPRAAVLPEDPLSPSSSEFGVSAEILSDVRALAEMQGREEPSAVADAWREFLRKHSEALGKEHRDVAGMMKTGDKRGVASYTGRHAPRTARSRSKRAGS